MYAKFREMNCLAELALNKNQAQINNQNNQEDIFRGMDVGKKGQAIQFQQPRECSILNSNTRFCNVNSDLCNEFVEFRRKYNGNNQKMYLYSSKNKQLNPCSSFYWVQPGMCHE